MIAKSWFIGRWQARSGSCVALAGTFLIGGSQGLVAQVVPDNTLGAESSVVTPDNLQGIESDRLDGGATRGANLFHSFEQFNVGTGRGAYFSNPAGIENILARVSGANRSQIFGRLGVLGNANLFLINPRGIVFGSGASLDVLGSFLATTADAVKLGDGGLFSATQPGATNLLRVSPSAILFNTIAAQPIVNQSRSPGSINQSNSAGLNPGLQVQPGRTLALIGGNVFLEGGNLTAAGGRIELGSVAGVGEVSLTPNENRFELRYDSINDFGNISLSNRAFVDASGEGGGDIQIRGSRLEMTQDSDIWADTLGAENGSEVLVSVAEVVLSDSLPPADMYATLGGKNLIIDIQDSLTELPENQLNTDSLLANSCIVRRNQPTRGSFTITGTGGLPQRPGDTQMSSFPTVDVETLPSDGTSSTPSPNRAWQKGEPIIEPQGVYRLGNGKLVLSRECS